MAGADGEDEDEDEEDEAAAANDEGWKEDADEGAVVVAGYVLAFPEVVVLAWRVNCDCAAPPPPRDRLWRGCRGNVGDAESGRSVADGGRGGAAGGNADFWVRARLAARE
jgi:hypothetical protein